MRHKTSAARLASSRRPEIARCENRGIHGSAVEGAPTLTYDLAPRPRIFASRRRIFFFVRFGSYLAVDQASAIPHFEAVVTSACITNLSCVLDCEGIGVR